MASLLDLFVRITADPSEYKKAIKESRETTEQFAKFAEAAGVRIATSLSFAGIAIGAVEAAEKFEKAGFQIQRSTGATGEKLEGLKGSLETLYAGSSRGADEIAAAMSQLYIRTGQTGPALEQLTSATLKFVKVSGGDLQESTRSTQKLFQQWAVSTDDQTRAMDMLYVASTKTGQSTQYFTDTLTTLGPTLRAYNFSFKDSVALIGMFAKAGLDAGDVARGLNTAFAKLAEAGKDPREELDRLIAKLGDTSSATQTAAALIELGFSKRAVVAMQDAIRRGVFSIDEFRDALDKSAGAVKRAASDTETLSDKWTKFLHVLQVETAPAGKVVLDLLGVLIEGAGTTLKAFQELGKGIVRALSGGSLTGEATEPKTLEEYDAAMAKTYGSNYWQRTDMQGKIAAAAREKWVVDHPAPAISSLNKTGVSDGGAASGRSYTIMSSIEVEVMRQSMANAKKTMIDFWTAGELGGKTLKVAIDATTAAIDATKGKGIDLVAVMQDVGATADMVELPAKKFSEVLSPAIRETEEAMHFLGIASIRELRAQYDYAMLAVQAMLADGAGVRDVGAAMAKVAEIHKQLSERMGDWDSQTKKVKRSTFDLGHEIEQMSHRAFDSLERGLARDIVEWKGWADTIKDIGKTLAQDFLSIMLKGLFKPLEDQFAKLAGKIGGWLGGIFGGGGSAAGTVASGAGSAGGAAGGGGGIASSVGGMAGTVNMISGAVSAVSSVVGNFQMAGMNKSLDVLVNHTLRIYNELANFRQDAWAREQHLMLKLDDMWNEIRNVVSATKSGGGGSGRAGISFTNCTFTGSPDAIASAIFTQASLAGAI